MQTSPEYVQQRGHYVIKFFQAMLESTIPINVIEALNGLILYSRLKSTFDSTEFSPLLRLLQSGVYAQNVVSLIARLHKFPVSEELVVGLLIRGKEISIAMATLLRLASVTAGRLAIVKYRHQMYEIAGVFPNWCFRLFLVVFDAKVFGNDPEFPEFLRKLVVAGDEVILRGMEIVFERLEIDDEFVYELSDIQFLSTYGEVGENSMGSWLSVFTKVAKIAWCEDIERCQNVLLRLLGRVEMREKLLNALLAIGKYESVVYTLKRSELMNWLRGLQNDRTVGSVVLQLMTLFEK
jgi:hypothetical protein